MPRIPSVRGRLKDIPVAGGKRVLLAAPRGYCAGVDRAVIAVEKALEHYGAPVYVRKQIVHNIHVVTELEKQGAIFVEEVDEVPEGAHIVFSAHGVSPAVVNSAADRGLHAIDATCPLVTKVHREAVRFARDDYEILLIGHEGHEEVEGTAGEAPDHVTLVNSPDDVPNIEVRDPDKVVWLSQTTLSVDETMETVRRLRERFPNLQDPPSDDICYATQNRQVAIKKVAQDADLVIVVGSANSSNSVRLVEVALEYGAKAAYRVDFSTEIKQEWLDGVQTIGVTSGASVPEGLVQEVLMDLADAGYGDVSEVKTAEEDLMFSLPKELRKDLAGNRDARALGGRTRG
ncbi:4-hydroxy-3-methylbut-2-enyl diphosphate reductase [Agromyces aerolatus]|uniref:4-hydroxy-3-methylbut-2-enyl diphosphate reductase n=1 Tax=Agromyces sp. LY-1074 TaxID=3074080 RepID=UPI00285BC6A3|nr:MULTISPECIES: 4-hydroxy-3-methylbut-2-enyl diphosphate reductase [unclassified Agromyces]MDR5698861.1 4-hydroxy-3-methylbut-2-enyl diphosphate reductase [Agromyces sp. LY-1074]MDR5705361.1 4-hydroxy-3-methylbut-2-enyl diphosphate reductase [Agromyces sp. LY-1358]